MAEMTVNLPIRDSYFPVRKLLVDPRVNVWNIENGPVKIIGEFSHEQHGDLNDSDW